MTPTLEPGVTLLWEEPLRGGATWSHVLKRGTALRIMDVQGGANVSALFYNAENTAERYNMPDTLKAQHVSRLTTGNALFSDMGRVLVSVTADTCGWHDPIAGYSNAASVRAKFGDRNYQQFRNEWATNALDSFLIELEKHGLSRRDLIPSVNLFSKVVVDDDGGMHFAEANSHPGTYVELRSEMNTLVVLNTCPHPLDPATEWRPKPVMLSVLRVPAPGPNDPCRISRPENGRAFTLTERYFL